MNQLIQAKIVQNNVTVKNQPNNQIKAVIRNQTIQAKFGENASLGVLRLNGLRGNVNLIEGENIFISVDDDTNQITITGQAGVGRSQGFVYVAKSIPVVGTRDGSFGRPFASIQDAINSFGVPTSQAQYLLLKNIEVLDTETYNENLTFPTGRWVLDFQKAFIVGNITWEVTNTERFGSTQQPTLVLQRDTNDIVQAITGNISVIRKAGGTVIPLGTLRLAGFNIQNGNVTIADGTNGGLTAFTTAVLSQVGIGYSGNSTIFARTAFVSFVDSGFNPTLAMEIGAITIVRDSTINSQDISEYINSTVTRFIRALRLNDSGNVTFRAIGSARNWNCDTSSASEVITKITSYPNNALNLIKPVASAVAIQDLANLYTATDVEGALAEISNRFQTGNYTPSPVSVQNVANVTISQLQFYRVLNMVTVFGEITITPNLNNDETIVGIPLPIASNLNNKADLSGTAYSQDNNASTSHGGSIYADTSNDRAELNFYEKKNGTVTMSFQFNYKII